MNYAFHLPAGLIIVVVALDASCGDPAWLPHPVRIIGRAIEAGDQYLHNNTAGGDLIRGALLAMAVILLAGLTTWAVIAASQLFSFYIGILAAVLIAWTTIAARGLDDAAQKVEHYLRVSDEDSARQSIRDLAGRDALTLDRLGLIRAAIESVAENSSDGIIAPLLFLVVAGPVGAITYKAINTLDSMIGYTNSRYLYFGRVAARLDDLVNLVPSRLTAISIGLAAGFVTGRMSKSIRTLLADGSKHESPNAGYPEAAMAGALGIELGGDAFYAGELVRHPSLGLSEVPLDLDALRSARIIMWVASAIALVLMLLLRGTIFRA
ncbi:MAG TPA: adenosylcobinamide-phosphate synthase CbiB [Candidatus Binataceae bacterium]|nr:adenosylcobinamide-phosphate synthase CbiB [Candidatus Binataceae bacterium]